MADDFGLKIGIEGEKQFKDALRDINQAFKVLGSEMALVTSQFDKNDKSVSALTSRNTVLNKEIEAQRDKIATLKSALDNASASFGENDRRTQNWQIQLNKAQAELNGMERELAANNKELEATVKGFGETGNEAEDFGRGLDAAGKETDRLGKSLDSTGKELSDAEKETAALGDSLSDAEKELSATSKETDNLGKEMEDTGKKTSVFGDVLKANLAADMIKVGATALVDMVKEVGAAVKGYISDGSRLASEAAENQAKLTQVMRNTMEASNDEVTSIIELTNAQERLGIVSSTVQQGGAQELGTYLTKTETLKNLIPVMNDMVAQQYGVNASQENAVNIATMLGKVMNGQVGALSRYGYSFDDAQAKILEFGTEEERAAVLAEVVGESVGGMNYALAQTDDGKMLQLNNTLEDTQRSVGLMANQWKAQMMGQMLPSVSNLNNAFLGLLHGGGSVEALASSFDEVFAQISDIITNFIPTVLDLGVQLIEALAMGLSNNVVVIIDGAASVLGKLVNALLDVLPIILDAGFEILMGLVKGIIDALPSVANAAVNIITTLTKGISDSLPELIPAAVSAITTIVQGLIDNLPQILDAALQIVIGLTAGILEALPVLIDALPAIISGIVDFIIDAIPHLINSGIQLLTSLVADLPTIIDSIVAAIPKIIDNIISAVIGAIPLIIDSGVKLLVSLIKNLPTIITTVVAAIPQIVGGLVETIIGNIDKIILAGVQLLVSLVENTPGIIIEVVKAIPMIIEAIVNAIGSLTWQIVEAGSNLIKGLWQGISNAKNWIMDKIRGFMSDITSSIRSFFGINSPSTVFADIGRNLGLGIGVGFEDAMDQVARDMRNAIPTNFDINPTMRGSYTGNYGYDGAYPSGTVINQNIAITSPKAMSEKEAAREFRNLSRKLAMGV